jgi:hypothetical protein
MRLKISITLSKANSQHPPTTTTIQPEVSPVINTTTPMGQIVKQMLDAKSAEQGNKQAVFNIGMVYGRWYLLG